MVKEKIAKVNFNHELVRNATRSEPHDSDGISMRSYSFGGHHPSDVGVLFSICVRVQYLEE